MKNTDGWWKLRKCSGQTSKDTALLLHPLAAMSPRVPEMTYSRPTAALKYPVIAPRTTPKTKPPTWKGNHMPMSGGEYAFWDSWQTQMNERERKNLQWLRSQKGWDNMEPAWFFHSNQASHGCTSMPVHQRWGSKRIKEGTKKKGGRTRTENKTWIYTRCTHTKHIVCSPYSTGEPQE